MQGMDGVQKYSVPALLESISRWNEVRQLSKSRYQAELAPDFSLMTWLQKDEMALSRYFAFLLDPGAAHGQSRLFLDGFIKLINKNSGKNKANISFGQDVRVFTEVLTDTGRRIDVLLTGKSGLIALENKPWAADQERQLVDYGEWLLKKKQPWSLIYLSNTPPTPKALPVTAAPDIRDHIVVISFFNIVEWLSSTVPYIKANNVKFFVESLIEFIRESVNGDYIMNDSQGLSEIILKDKESIHSAFIIANQIPAIQKKVFFEFIDALREYFSDYPLIINAEEDPSVRFGGFHILFHPKSERSLFWEFSNGNYNNLYFGITAKEEEQSQNDMLYKAMCTLFHGSIPKSSKWCAWWSWDMDPLGQNRIPRSWGNDGSVWVTLGERGESSVFAAVRDVILRVYQELDLDLMR